jgi:hypothetical protein
MSRTNEVTRNLLKQGPGLVESHAVAADIQTITQRKLAHHNNGTADSETSDGSDFAILVSRHMRCTLSLAWRTLQ